jgi:hypothetical protein
VKSRLTGRELADVFAEPIVLQTVWDDSVGLEVHSTLSKNRFGQASPRRARFEQNKM